MGGGYSPLIMHQHVLCQLGFGSLVDWVDSTIPMLEVQV